MLFPNSGQIALEHSWQGHRDTIGRCSVKKTVSTEAPRLAMFDARYRR